MSRSPYPPRIFVRDDGDGDLVIVGQDVARLDADDGDRMAVYQCVSVQVYRTHPRLEPVPPAARRKRTRAKARSSPRA